MRARLWVVGSLLFIAPACGGGAPLRAREPAPVREVEITSAGTPASPVEPEAAEATETVETAEPPAPAFVVTEGPAGAAAVPGADLETLGPWTWPLEIEAGARLFPLGPRLVAVGAHLVVFSADGSTRTRSRSNPLGAATAAGEATSARPPSAAGLLFVRGSGDHVLALDPATLEVRWTTTLSRGRGGSEEHLATRDAFIVVTTSSMYGLDAATGRHLFARPLDEHERGPGYQAWRSAAGAVVSVGPNGYHVIGRDGRTGHEIWRAEIGEARLYEGDDDRVVAIVDHQTLVVLGASDGAELARIALDDVAWHGRTVSLDGGEVHVLCRAGDTSLRVVSYELASGRRLWRSEPLSLRADDHAELAADGDAIFVCAGERLTALDRSDGRARWWAHPAGCAGLRTWRPVEGEAALVLSAYGGSAYARTGVPRTLRRLRVSGTITVEGAPRARVTVRVGGEHATTNARGRYAASVEAWDDVRVEVDCEGCRPDGATILATDPDTSPTVDLDLEAIRDFEGGLI